MEQEILISRSTLRLTSPCSKSRTPSPSDFCQISQIELDYIDIVQASGSQSSPPPTKDEKQQVYKFPLFAAFNSTLLQENKIAVQDFNYIALPPDSIGDCDAAVTASFSINEPGKARPHSHYFRDELSPTEIKSFAATAVSGEQVIARAQIPWPGCRLPWRVVYMVPLQQQQQKVSKCSKYDKPPFDTGLKKRTRLGKKARVAKRKGLMQEQAKINIKEQLASEKRLRKNRAQKLRKRQKKRSNEAVPEV